ncbi:MAG: ABC transporter permease [Nitrospirae bacterium]|nr:ABC transporter permease [Nitrospirota bacterium]
MNPVLIREWKYFFRGRAPYYFLIFYAILLLLIFYGAIMPALQGAVMYDNSLKSAGKILTGRLFAAQLLLTAFAFPAFAVRLMTRERDGDMLELLQIAPYGLMKIIFCKITASIIIWMLLILIAIPLFLLSLSTGGITMEELALLLSLLTAFVLCCGVTGLFSALLIKRPEHSLAAAYSFIFMITTAYLAGYLYYPSSIVTNFLAFSF